MTRARAPRPDEGWRPIAAAFAVFAILMQALMPAAAHAAQARGSTLVVCAIDGAHSVRVQQVPGKAKGFAGLPCPDCLTAAVAMVLAPPLASVAPAPFACAATEYQPGPAVRLACARAPPRPPGQGPPTA